MTVRLSDHARERCTQMGVAHADVIAAVEEPETSYPGSPQHEAGRSVFTRGPLAVVVEDATRTVITVLVNREDARRRIGEEPS